MKTNKKGFTLIELLIVIAVIAILAAVIIANTSSARIRARDARRIQDLDQIALAATMYYSENDDYPGSIGVMVPKYLSAEPKDPKDGITSYDYEKGTKGASNTPKILLRAELENDNKALDSDVDTAADCIDSPTVITNCTDSPTLYYCVCR